MTNNTVTPLVQPGEFSDLLTDVLRNGAQQLLAHAVEAEVADFITRHAGDRLEDGRARVVRTGICPSAIFKPALALSPSGRPVFGIGTCWLVNMFICGLTVSIFRLAWNTIASAFW